MHAIHRYKIILILLLCRPVIGFSQPNLEQYDTRLFHFGFTLALNNGLVRIDTKSTSFQPPDSMLGVHQNSFPGIGLGAISNLHLGDNWDLRLMFPVISFVERDLNYNFVGTTKNVKIESSYCDASLLIKYKSARRKNTRAYVITGLRASYDLSSTVHQDRSRQTPVVSIVPLTFGYEGGFGLDIYFEYFKFSPEIKICNTLGSYYNGNFEWGNAMYRDGFIYTNCIQNLSPKLFQFSLHFE
ncbi:MAG: outer membrane beta-barrel protein [Bacteroidia bacterium]